MGDSIKDRLSNFSSFGRLRLQVSHGTIIAYSALFLIIFIAFTIRILALRWENLTEGTALLNEFDPYYQFSITKYMVDNGPISPYYPTPWINMQKWYPDGLDMSLSLPALPMTGWAIYSSCLAVWRKLRLNDLLRRTARIHSGNRVLNHLLCR